MGAGKTTVGKQLAKSLEMDFYDTDLEIEKRSGVRISTIFEMEGESGFRKREAAMIDELTQMQNIVLATGGGAVINPENRQLLASRGTVIYLRASIDDLLQRTQNDKNRPLLQTADPRAKLESLFAQRDPLYREVADIIIDTSRQNVHLLVNRLLQRADNSMIDAAITAEVQRGIDYVRSSVADFSEWPAKIRDVESKCRRDVDGGVDAGAKTYGPLGIEIQEARQRLTRLCEADFVVYEAARELFTRRQRDMMRKLAMHIVAAKPAYLQPGDVRPPPTPHAQP